MNKATGERKCIVCGGLRAPPVGKMILCELCPRAYHHDCYIPPLIKVPRGKWYCHGCVSKAPPPKKRVRKSKDMPKLTLSTSSQHSAMNVSQPDETTANHPCASPTYSVASTSYDENSSIAAPQPSLSVANLSSGGCGAGGSTNLYTSPPPNLHSTNSNSSTGFGQQQLTTVAMLPNVNNNGVVSTVLASQSNSNTRPSSPTTSDIMHNESMDDTMNSSGGNASMLNDVKEKLKQEKKDKQHSKKLIKEMSVCKQMLEEMEVSFDNVKHFP